MADADGPVGTGSLIKRTFDEVLSRVRAQTSEGMVADYIPELATADPDAFAVAVTSIHGRAYGAGERADRFTIQSISKAFVFALALAEHGAEKVSEHVGVEPSGEEFNAISFDKRGRPENPMINAGAIVTTSLIRARDGAERFERIRSGLSAFAGRELELDARVYASESATGDRNRALAALARSTKVLACELDEAVEPYFQQCSLRVDTADLSVMAATLANNGVNPVTGDWVVGNDVARDTLSVMTGCGMYNRSGRWMFDVGIPAKSGVSGGIIAVAPGQYGIGVYSPPLDKSGNSVRGVQVLRMLSMEFGLHIFDHPDLPTSPVQEIRLDGSALTIRLRGAIDFSSAEEIVHGTVNAVQESSTVRLAFDFSGVTSATRVARLLLRRLSDRLGDGGYVVSIYDPEGMLAVGR